MSEWQAQMIDKLCSEIDAKDAEIARLRNAQNQHNIAQSLLYRTVFGRDDGIWQKAQDDAWKKAAETLLIHKERANDSARKHLKGEIDYAPGAIRHIESTYPGIRAKNKLDFGYWKLMASNYGRAADIITGREWEDE